MKSTEDFLTWSAPIILSDTSLSCYLPIADCNLDGTLNVMWLQNTSDTTVSAIYGQIEEGKLVTSKEIARKREIVDISIANHLMYENNVLYFGYQYDQDSLIFCSSQDYLLTIDTIYANKGSQPGLTINSYYEGAQGFNLIRVVFRDTSMKIMEWEQDEGEDWDYDGRIIRNDTVDYICVDDIMAPLGYSYIFMKNDSLFHGFSFGRFRYDLLLDTISTNPIYPSLAYKQFSSEYIDFIWMQESEPDFTIHYKRDEKYQYIYRGVDENLGKGFKITGYPNPFTEYLSIQVEVETTGQVPSIDIFDVNSRLIQSLKAESVSGNNYQFRWNSVKNGGNVPAGLYFIRCTVGNSRIVKKVIKAE